MYKELQAFADLKLEHMHTCVGVNSMVIIFKNNLNVHCAETLVFNSKGFVKKLISHYFNGKS